MRNGTTIPMRTTFDQAVDATRAALAGEGFGVSTGMGMQATLRDKVGRQISPYLILAAGNPLLADQALSLQPSIRLLPAPTAHAS